MSSPEPGRVRILFSILLALAQLPVLVPPTAGNTHLGVFPGGSSGLSAVFGVGGGNETVANLTMPAAARVLNASLSIEGLPVVLSGDREYTTDDDFASCGGKRNVTISGGSVSLGTAKGGWSQSADGQFRDDRLENVEVSGGVRLARGARASLLVGDFCAQPAATSQTHPLAATNSRGDLIVVWEDYRSGTDLDLYGRRFDPSGTPLGAEFPVCTAAGHQYNPALAVDGSDDLYVLWQDGRSGQFDILGQKFDSSGAKAGGEIPVCTSDGDQSRPSVCIDSQGRLLAAWDDFRDGRHYYIRTLLLDPDGAPAGTEQELPSGTLDKTRPSACALFSGFVVAWQTSGNQTGADIEGISLDSQGTPAGSVFSITNASSDQTSVRLAPGAGGSWTAVWEDGRGGTDVNIYGRRFDSAGNPAGAETPVCLAAGDQRNPVLSALSSGMTVVAWEDGRRAGTDAYFKVFDASFDVIGTEQSICSERLDQDTPAVAFAATGSFFAAWADWRDGMPNIWANKFGSPRNVYSSGELLSPEIPCFAATYGSLGLCISLPRVARSRVDTTGFQVDVLDGRELNVLQAGCLPGGSILVDNRYHDSIRLRIRMWTADENITPVLRKWSVGTGLEEDLDFLDGAACAGTRARNGEVVLQDDGNLANVTGDVPVMATEDNDQEVAVASLADGSGDFVAAWQTGTGPSSAVLANRFARNGTPYGPAVLVCNATGPQEYPDIAVDLNGQSTVVWADNRSGRSLDVYGRRFDPKMAPAGPEFLVCGTADDQRTPVVATDLENNFIVVWVDCQKVYTLLFFQKFHPDTTPFSAPVQVSWTQFNMLQPSIDVDGYGRFYIAWSDYRGGGFDNYDIYAAVFLPGCEPVHPGKDLPVCQDAGDQRAPSIAVGPEGDFAVAWDGPSASSDTDISARRFDPNGTPLTPEFAVSAAASIQRNPEIALDPDGNILAVWQTIGDVFDIDGRLFGPDGSPLGPEFVICDAKNVAGEPADQVEPALSCGAGNDFIVAWQDIRAKYSSDVWAKGYGYPGYRTAGTFLTGPYDLGHAPVSFDEAGWKGTTVPGTAVSASMRTSADGQSWSAWEGIGRTKSPPASPPARYVQWMFDLASTDGRTTPVLQGLLLRYTSYSTNGTLVSPPFPVEVRISGFSLKWNASHNGEAVAFQLSQDDDTTWTAWDPETPPRMDPARNASVFRWRAFLYSNGSASPVLEDVFMGYQATGYPTDARLDLGGDGRPEWSLAGELDTTCAVGGLEAPLNEMLESLGGGPGDIAVPVVLHSATPGTIRLSNLSIDYDIPPVIDSSTPEAGTLSILETESALFSVSARDPDGDRLSYAWSVDGRVAGTDAPDFTFGTDFDTGGTYNVTVSVSDGLFAVNRSWTLFVRNSNRPPALEWHPGGDVRINETEKLSFWVSAGDPDGDAVAVSWLLDGSPAGNGTVFDYAPDYDASGVHNLTVRATDGNDTAVHSWTVTVANRNRPPELRSSSPPLDSLIELRQGAARDLTVAAFDPDGDALTYNWTLNGKAVPGVAGASYNCRKGLREGMNVVRLTVSDGNATAACEWTVRVTANPGNDVTTGDGTALALLAILLVIIAMGAAAFVLRSRRKPGDGLPPADPARGPGDGPNINFNNRN